MRAFNALFNKLNYFGEPPFWHNLMFEIGPQHYLNGCSSALAPDMAKIMVEGFVLVSDDAFAPTKHCDTNRKSHFGKIAGEWLSHFSRTSKTNLLQRMESVAELLWRMP